MASKEEKQPIEKILAPISFDITEDHEKMMCHIIMTREKQNEIIDRFNEMNSLWLSKEK